MIELMLLIGQAEISPFQIAILVAIGFAFLALLVVGGFFMSFFRWWLQAALTRAKISFWDLTGMWFRKVKPSIIVPSKIMAVQAGLSDPDLTTKNLEAHYLAGGNVPMVVRALIAAHKAKTIKLSFREAAAIDLAGRNVLEAVQTSVYPLVIDCPARGSARKSLDAVAKNGIQLKV